VFKELLAFFSYVIAKKFHVFAFFSFFFFAFSVEKHRLRWNDRVKLLGFLDRNSLKYSGCKKRKGRHKKVEGQLNRQSQSNKKGN